MSLIKCALCLHLPVSDDGTADDAATVINGQAVCYHHMGYVAGGDFTRALGLWREAKEPKPVVKVNPRQCLGAIGICVEAGEHQPPCQCVRPSGHGGPHMSGGAW